MLYLIERNKTVEKKILYHIYSKQIMQKIKQIEEKCYFVFVQHCPNVYSFTRNLDTSVQRSHWKYTIFSLYLVSTIPPFTV